MEDYIAAIDLGTTKVVTLIGRRSAKERVHVLASSETPSQGILRGEVFNIGQVLEATKSTVDDVRNKSGIHFQEVFVGIAGKHVRCTENSWDYMRDNENEEITEQEIDKMKAHMYKTGIAPDEEILHVIPQSYNVDDHFNVSSPVGSFGKRLGGNYRIVIGKSISARYAQRCIERAGLILKRPVLEPLASAKAVLSDEEKEIGVAMVDIGGGTTDVAVYYDKIVRHTAVIPFGGHVITEDIRHGCGVRLLQANAMKEQYGSCYSDLVENSILVIPSANGQEREISFRYLAGIIEARMEEILEAVMYEIERSGYADKLSAGIVFTGGGAMIQHLVEFVQHKTGYPARVAKPLHITDDSPAEIRRSSYSTAVGLLLTGLEEEEKMPVPGPVLVEVKAKVDVVPTETKIDKDKDKRDKTPRKIKWPVLPFGEIFGDNTY
jgi:cell division protein FtsA